MNETRMRAILEAYGADPARWPPAERVAASAWLEANAAQVADALAAARAVDGALALDTRAEGASEDLAARILAQRPGGPATGAASGGGAKVVAFPARFAGWRAVVALAACAAVGVVVGFGAVGGDEDLAGDAEAVLGEAFGVGG